MPLSNPFFHRGLIRDRAYFLGRDPETSQALSLLGNGQSIALVRQRRIGKTCLLFHLADTAVFSRHGLSPTERLFIERACLIVRRGAHYDYLSSAFRAFAQTQPIPGLQQAGRD